MWRAVALLPCCSGSRTNQVCRPLSPAPLPEPQGYGQPIKFLGCGVCDNLSRSVTLARYTDSSEELARCARDMLRALHVPPEDMRGVGLAVSAEHGTSLACPGMRLLVR